MHPVTLLAVLLLVLNDWVLKPAITSAHAWDTPAGLLVGKLSDVAGLAFAPVVLTAAIGLLLAAAARLGAPIDPSLTRRRLLLAIAATAVTFAAIKLSPAVSDAFVHLTATITGRPAQVILDRSDLLALPALAVAYVIGRDELRRIPLGKPAAIHRLRRSASAALIDSHRAGADTRELAGAIDAWDTARIDAILAATHASTHAR